MITKNTFYLSALLRWGLVLALVALALTTWPAPVAHAATIAVDTTADELDGSPGNGDCSLREAITNANADDAGQADCTGGSGADVITLPAGTYTLTGASGEDSNASGDLDITDDLVINGAGSGSTFIQAGTDMTNGVDRVMHIVISGPGTVEINDVTIRYGKAPDGGLDGIGESGGGILNSETLTLNDCAVNNNSAGSGGDGSAGNPGQRAGDGGGIYNFGTLTLNNCTVDGNVAGDGGDAAAGSNGNGGGGGRGGGIGSSTMSGAVTLNNTIVSNNTTGDGGNGDGTGRGGSGGDGGGIHYQSDNTLALDGNTVSGNVTGAAGTGSSIAYRGDAGGIQADGITTLDRTTVSDNEAHRGGGIYGYCDSATLNASTVSGNNADADGGGIYLTYSCAMTLTNSTVSSNVAGDDGGGIGSNSSAPTVLLHSTIALNTANGDSDAVGDGGGVYSAGSGMFNSMNTIIADNMDLAGGGGTVHPDCSATLVSQGNTWLEDASGCTYTAGTGDNTGDPGLGALADNGGPTWTHALLAGSLAIDAGTPTNCPSTDQRGAARPFDGNGNTTATCDVGAYEYRGIDQQCSLGQGTYTFGSVSIQVVTLGSLTCLSVEEMGASHPLATGTSGGTGIVTGNYWRIEATATSSDWSVNLTLPHSDVVNPSVCKWPGGLGGYGWDCAATSSTAATVTRNGLGSLSDWAVGTDVGPTVVSLREASAAGASVSTLWLVLPVLGAGAGALLWRVRQRRRRSTL